MDTTEGIVKFWQLCSPKRNHDENPVGVMPIETLKSVIDKELIGRLDVLGYDTVDELLVEYMMPGARGHVGFLQYWQGMEQIMQQCRAAPPCNNLSRSKHEALQGFQYLRRCILEMSSKGVSQDRNVLQVRELRYFIGRTITTAGAAGKAYWQHQAERLQVEDDVCVTGEEVAVALLQWLEELLEGDSDEDVSSNDSEESLDEGAASRRPPSYLGNSIARSSVAHSEDRGASKLMDMAPPIFEPEVCKPRAPSFVDRLEELLRRVEHRPGSPTKEAAAEWRDSMAFHSLLSRTLQETREAFTMRSFHLFASGHFSRRRAVWAASPSHVEQQRRLGRAALLSALRGLVRRRQAEAFGAFAGARRRARGAGPGPPSGICRELLRSQCETALALEQRVSDAERAGGLVLCLARLQRVRLRGAWVQMLRG